MLKQAVPEGLNPMGRGGPHAEAVYEGLYPTEGLMLEQGDNVRRKEWQREAVMD